MLRLSLRETSKPDPAGFRVVEALLEVDPPDYRGPCPVTIKFSGQISVSGGSGKVSYKFLPSDGASSPLKTVSFDAPGTKSFSTTWSLGGPGLPTYSGWQTIQIIDPIEMKSNQVRDYYLAIEEPEPRVQN